MPPPPIVTEVLSPVTLGSLQGKSSDSLTHEPAVATRLVLCNADSGDGDGDSGKAAAAASAPVTRTARDAWTTGTTVRRSPRRNSHGLCDLRPCHDDWPVTDWKHFRRLIEYP